MDCIAERIADINPNAAIAVCPMSLDDVSDIEFELLALRPMNWRPTPETTLLCGLTDSFPAQARINRQFGQTHGRVKLRVQPTASHIVGPFACGAWGAFRASCRFSTIPNVDRPFVCGVLRGVPQHVEEKLLSLRVMGLPHGDHGTCCKRSRALIRSPAQEILAGRAAALEFLEKRGVLDRSRVSAVAQTRADADKLRAKIVAARR